MNILIQYFANFLRSYMYPKTSKYIVIFFEIVILFLLIAGVYIGITYKLNKF